MGKKFSKHSKSNCKEGPKFPDSISNDQMEMLEVGRIPRAFEMIVEMFGVNALFDHFGLSVPDNLKGEIKDTRKKY